MKTENKRAWIILMDTHCGGETPAYRDGDGNPIFYETQKEAVTEMVNDRIEILQDQLEQYSRGVREMEEIDLDCEEWVEPCEIRYDGDKVIVVLDSGKEFF
jgi:hypothetical protein